MAEHEVADYVDEHALLTLVVAVCSLWDASVALVHNQRIPVFLGVTFSPFSGCNSAGCLVDGSQKAACEQVFHFVSPRGVTVAHHPVRGRGVWPH